MTLKLAEFIKETVENKGGEVVIHEGYSGRGMFGAKTAGICIDDPMEMFCLLINGCRELDVSETPEFPHGFSQDNMGRATILY